MRLIQKGFFYTSFARGLAEALIDTTQLWLPGFGGESLTRAKLFGGEYSFAFLGDNLILDENDAVSGNVTRIEVFATGAESPAVIGRNVNLAVEDIVSAAGLIANDGFRIGSDGFRSAAFQEFLQLLGIDFQRGSNARDVMETTPEGAPSQPGKARVGSFSVMALRIWRLGFNRCRSMPVGAPIF